METNSKFLRLFGVVVFLVFLVAACGPAATTVAPASTSAPTTVTTIDVLHIYSEGVADQAQMVEWGKKFEALNPQYKINWIWGGAQIDTLFQADVNSGNVPDLVYNNDATIASLARQGGVLQPLNKYLDTQNYESNAIWKDTFYPGLLTNALVDTSYYAIPDSMYFPGVWYDKVMFDKQGYKIPQTWPEMLALCDQIKKDLNIPCFDQDNAGWTNKNVAFYIIERAVGGQALYDAGMGKTTFNTPGFLLAAQTFQDLTTKHFASGWSGSQWPAAEADWATGGAAMFIMPSWLPSEVASIQMEGFTPKVFPVPTIPGGYTGTPELEVKFNGWALPVGAKHPDAAIVFAKFFTSSAYQKARSDGYSLASSLPSVGLPPSIADFQPALVAAHTIRFGAGLDADASDWEAKVFQPLNTSLATGQLTPAEFIQQLDTQTKVFYKK